MKTMKISFINIVIAVSIITVITQSAEFANATMDNTDIITCQHGDGTTMGGTFHFAGNCQGDTGYTVYGGGFNADSKACEGHAVKGPYDNAHFRGTCISK